MIMYIKKVVFLIYENKTLWDKSTIKHIRPICNGLVATVSKLSLNNV